MKQDKEGTYGIENIWAKGMEKDGVWSYIELNTHKTMNVVLLQNVGILKVEGKRRKCKKRGTN